MSHPSPPQRLAPTAPPARKHRWVPVHVALTALFLAVVAAQLGLPLAAAAVLVLGVLASLSFRIAAEWEKAVVLRFGRFRGLKGPGLIFLVPFVDTVAYWIDQRITATPFIAEQTLTRDTVPVDVDAILFWVVWDPQKAALEVEDYRQAVAWSAQTALRDVVGRSELAELLSGRERLDQVLQGIIDARTEPWGVTVQSVEIRDVVIPEPLQDAMSREAQAERERRARIILGSAEAEIAQKFADAAVVYEASPVSLQLRAMNILYDGMKEHASLVITPSGVADSLNVPAFLAGRASAASGDHTGREKSATNFTES